MKNSDHSPLAKLILVAMSALTLAACGQDNSICKIIIEPTTPDDGSSNGGRESMAAEACIHRQAYNLAKSSDPAEIVAKATVESCEQQIDTAARTSAHYTTTILKIEEEGHIDQRIGQIKEGYERFALLKVVEGRAGKCKS